MDLNHVDVEQVPDADPHRSESWIRIQIRTKVKSLIRIRIRIKVMRIRNPGVKKGKKRPVIMGMCA
jgi:hypothetical protein